MMSTPHSLRLSAIAAMVCCVSLAARAGPPFLTDDPDPVDLHHAEVNFIYQQTRTSDGRAGAVSAELNYGCARETQCHVAVPVAFDHANSGRAQTGLGDLELGLKYRVLDAQDSRWSAAVYPTVTLPTGNQARGLGNGRTQLLVPLWVQHSAGPWNLDAGIAWLGSAATVTRNSVFVGLLAQRSFGDEISVGAEIYRRTASAGDISSSWGFNIGAIARIRPDQNILFSIGRGLSQVRANHGSVFFAYQFEI